MFRHLKAFVAAVAVIFILLLGLKYFLPSTSESPIQVGFMENQKISDFEYKTLDGNTRRLSDSYGKLVLVNFWASWCSPCVKEVPSLVDLVEKMNGKLELIAVSGDSNLGDVNAFISSFPTLKKDNIYIVWDRDRDLMKRFGVERLPETFILNSRGLFKKKISGEVDWSSSQAIDLFEKILNEK